MAADALFFGIANIESVQCCSDDDEEPHTDLLTKIFHREDKKLIKKLSKNRVKASKENSMDKFALEK